MLKITIEKRIPERLTEIINCIAFWNTTGRLNYERNRAGTMGSKFTQEEANKLTYENWILNCINEDLKTIIGDDKTFKHGRAGSHVWASYGPVTGKENERIFLISF